MKKVACVAFWLSKRSLLLENDSFHVTQSGVKKIPKKVLFPKVLFTDYPVFTESK